MSTEQYQIGYEDGRSAGFDEAVKQPAQPDCRTCAHQRLCVACEALPNCTNGDKYEPAPAVVLWRTE